MLVLDNLKWLQLFWFAELKNWKKKEWEFFKNIFEFFFKYIFFSSNSVLKGNSVKYFHYSDIHLIIMSWSYQHKKEKIVCFLCWTVRGKCIISSCLCFYPPPTETFIFSSLKVLADYLKRLRTVKSLDKIENIFNYLLHKM